MGCEQRVFSLHLWLRFVWDVFGPTKFRHENHVVPRRSRQHTGGSQAGGSSALLAEEIRFRSQHASNLLDTSAMDPFGVGAQAGPAHNSPRQKEVGVQAGMQGTEWMERVPLPAGPSEKREPVRNGPHSSTSSMRTKGNIFLWSATLGNGFVPNHEAFVWTNGWGRETSFTSVNHSIKIDLVESSIFEHSWGTRASRIYASTSPPPFIDRLIESTLTFYGFHEK